MVTLAGLQHILQRTEVVAVIHQRLLHRFGYALKGGEMDDAGYWRFLFQHLEECVFVTNIYCMIFDAYTRDLFNPVDGFGCGSDTAVHCNRFKLTAFNKFDNGVRTNVACASCNDDFLFHFLCKYLLLYIFSIQFANLRKKMICR